MTYESLKEKYQTNKPRVLLAVLFAAVFASGYGVGSYNKSAGLLRDRSQTKNNYNTNFSDKQKTVKEAQTLGAEKNTALKAPAGEGKTVDCYIKGNISTKGDKVYHMPKGAFYAKTQAERCFASESEAVAAGFRKSSR